MRKKKPYKSFSNYILRTPLFSFGIYKELTLKESISDDDFKKICDNIIFKEALYLATPSLFKEMQRWLKGEIKDRSKQEKLKYSILKYFSRMSSRCTPFGLFAGCSVGKFGDDTSIKLEGANYNKRHTRLDMNYLVALTQDLVKIKYIREQLLFFPNSSIYEVGDKLRYVEYKYFNSRRQHQIVAVDNTSYLQLIFSKAANGALLLDLANVLVGDDITIDIALEFIEELIFSQLLISELEPSVSGPEFLKQIYLSLEKVRGTKGILNILKDAEQKINCIDKTIGNNPKVYMEISESLKKIDTDFDFKFMFQTDMLLNSKKNTLNQDIINNVKKGFTLLNKITFPPYETQLTKFKDAFEERYGEREMKLSTVLDVEVGIGYKQVQGEGDVSPLIDDLIITGRQIKLPGMDIKWTLIHAILDEKLRLAFRDNSYVIILTDEDFKNFEANWDDLPDTLSSVIEVVEDNGEQKIKYNGGGGSSSANLFGRFCHGNQELHEYTKEIIDIETNINKGKILAEIVHLPESRVGNILMRPDFRKYEIPYLAKSIKEKKNQITLDDLMISVRNNKILLRSKKYNKEVIPHLTNAHNYSRNSLPIYHFLADMQNQDKRSGVGFNLGPLTGDYEFLPRVEYNNLILHNATWNLNESHIELLLKHKNNNGNLIKTIKALRKRLKIPQYVTLVEGDNELLINFENLTTVRMLLETVKKRSRFKLTEFLFSENSIVKGENDYYTNQIIVSFYNEEKLNNSKNAINV